MKFFYLGAFLFSSFLVVRSSAERPEPFHHQPLPQDGFLTPIPNWFPTPIKRIPPLPNTGIESKNPPFTEEGEQLWEGDMILTKEQVEMLYDKSSDRKAISDLAARWPNGYIPFEIDPSSAQDRQVILSALDHWMSNTCLYFSEVPIGSKGYHLIFKKKTGCNSHVGKSWYWNPDGQDVSIGQGCADMGTVAHEVGHAIGFYHEQSRPDRDNYVKILTNNIIPNQTYNFNLQQDINDYKVPYDLTSLMHYGSDYFTRNGKNTIVTLDPMKQFEIGQRAQLSFKDIKLANLMYNCSDQCTSKPTCQNGGFIDRTCKCKCPPLTKGNNCEINIPAPAPTCGGIITSPQTITSPNYPNKYPKGSKCVWRIKAPQGKIVTAFIKTFDLLYRDTTSGKCPWDTLEFRTNSIIEGDIYCGQELQGKGLASTQNEMIILFKSLYDWNKGFEIHINFK